MKKITITLVCTLFLGFAAFAQSDAPVKNENTTTATKAEATEIVQAVSADEVKKDCSKAKASCCAKGKKAEGEKASIDEKASAEAKTVAANAEEKKKGCCSKAAAKESSCHGSKASTMASAEKVEKTEVQAAEPKAEKQ